MRAFGKTCSHGENSERLRPVARGAIGNTKNSYCSGEKRKADDLLAVDWSSLFPESHSKQPSAPRFAYVDLHERACCRAATAFCGSGSEASSTSRPSGQGLLHKVASPIGCKKTDWPKCWQHEAEKVYRYWKHHGDGRN